MFVRVVRGPSETLFLSAPYAWNDFDVSRLRGLGGLEEILSESGTARLEVASRVWRMARCSRWGRAVRIAKCCSPVIAPCWQSSRS